ncbi:uncharacterized protein LOC135172608 [Diachasmimorpha longicaudata]|uniref:uncharacterized protein LOC135172608 n=1 Tax=Diachasmimorpha longicaudata TaxID=58733 RepID=UPI0030B8FE6F
MGEKRKRDRSGGNMEQKLTILFGGASDQKVVQDFSIQNFSPNLITNHPFLKSYNCCYRSINVYIFLYKKQSSSRNSNPIEDAIDFALAQFFFACNISFNVVESPHFKNFIGLLHPSSKISTRKKLSTKLLDKVHQSLVHERVSLRGSQGVLLTDGWTNSAANTKNVVCAIHKVNSKSIFLKSWDLTEVSETGEELRKIVDEDKCLAQEKFNIDVYAVVSDNASAMVSMGKKVDIWHTTCESHSGNLLAQAFVPEIFTKKVNKLLREFKTPGAEHELKLLGGSRIYLACETRWCSYRDAFRCLLKNFHLMNMLCYAFWGHNKFY